jgi:CheY-like chemotaxis protein
MQREQQRNEGDDMASAMKNVIVVDDEKDTRTTLAQILTQLGHNVRSAEEGFSALGLIRETVPDVLVSDLNMPGMSGFELLSVVRRRHPKIYVIATSGAFSGKSVPEGVAADAFYEKATGMGCLLELVKQGGVNEDCAQTRSAQKVPIWMTPTGKLPSREIYVLMACPECMRAFPKLLEEETSHVCETRCYYCQAGITYAMVQADGVLATTKGKAVGAGRPAKPRRVERADEVEGLG